MKAICVASPNNQIIEEREIPKIENASEVLLKVKAGEICRSMYILL